MKYLIFALVSLNLFAVDGYKDFKLGSKLKDTIPYKACPFVKDSNASEGEIEIYTCEKYQVSGEVRPISLMFVNDKLERIALAVGVKDEDFVAYTELLLKKYGKLSSYPDKKSRDGFDSGDMNQMDVGFDKGTVISRIIRHSGNQKLVMLIYTVADFDQKVSAARKSKISLDDI